MIRVEEIMTPEPSTLGPDDTLADARRLMAEKRIRHIPIVDGADRVVGLVTESDALAAMDSVLDPERRHDETGVTLRSVMTPDPMTTHPQEPLLGAARFMEKHRYGCLPVIDDSGLCGIVTDTDFVGLAINLLEQAEVEDVED